MCWSQIFVVKDLPDHTEFIAMINKFMSNLLNLERSPLPIASPFERETNECLDFFVFFIMGVIWAITIRIC